MTPQHLKIPYSVFNDWNLLQVFLYRRGNPDYELIGDIDLRWQDNITSLGNLVQVDGNLNLGGSSIKSLGKLKHITGNLNFCDLPNH